MNQPKLAAFKVERRLVAAAVFSGEQIEYTHVRHLTSDASTAESAAVQFARWIVTTLEVRSVALETVSIGKTSRRTVLTDSMVNSLRDGGVSIQQVPKAELLRAFGVPPLKTRKELRGIIRTFWPVLPAQRGNGSTLDAAALGLYVQIQRELESFNN